MEEIEELAYGGGCSCLFEFLPEVRSSFAAVAVVAEETVVESGGKYLVIVV